MFCMSYVRPRIQFNSFEWKCGPRSHREFIKISLFNSFPKTARNEKNLHRQTEKNFRFDDRPQKWCSARLLILESDPKCNQHKSLNEWQRFIRVHWLVFVAFVLGSWRSTGVTHDSLCLASEVHTLRVMPIVIDNRKKNAGMRVGCWCWLPRIFWGLLCCNGNGWDCFEDYSTKTWDSWVFVLRLEILLVNSVALNLAVICWAVEIYLNF